MAFSGADGQGHQAICWMTVAVSERQRDSCGLESRTVSHTN